jgi:hypothetical protein
VKKELQTEEGVEMGRERELDVLPGLESFPYHVGPGRRPTELAFKFCESMESFK